MRWSNRYSPTTLHWKRGLLATEWIDRDGEDQHDRRSDPAARAAHRDGPDVLGPPRRHRCP